MHHLRLITISGYTEGSTEVQRFTSVGVNNFAYNYNVTLAHTSVIYVTIIATNAAGLMTKVHARSLLVDLTPPNIIFVNDGIGTCIKNTLVFLTFQCKKKTKKNKNHT